MKTIKLPCYGNVIVVQIEEGDDNEVPGGTIQSDLHEDFPPKIGPDWGDAQDEVDSIADYNHAMDGIEALVLGHACSGIDVTSPEYIEGIETAVQAAANNL